MNSKVYSTRSYSVYLNRCFDPVTYYPLGTPVGEQNQVEEEVDNKCSTFLGSDPLKERETQRSAEVCRESRTKPLEERCISEVCQQINLANFTISHYRLLFATLGVDIPKSEIKTLRSIFQGNDYSVSRHLLPRHPANQGIGKQVVIFDRNNVRCTVINTAQGSNLLKSVDCSWEDGDWNDLIIEAAIQAYLAQRFPGKVPNIYSIYQTPESEVVLEMEYIAGGTLEDAIKRGAITHQDFCLFIQKTARIIGEMQESVGFIHNDLSVKNIAIRSNLDGDQLPSDPVLIDFGQTTVWSKKGDKYKMIGGFDMTFCLPNPADYSDDIVYLPPYTQCVYSSLFKIIPDSQRPSSDLQSPKKVDDSLQPSTPLQGAKKVDSEDFEYQVSLKKKCMPLDQVGDLMYLVYTVLKTLYMIKRNPTLLRRFDDKREQSIKELSAIYTDLYDLFNLGHVHYTNKEGDLVSYQINLFDVLYQLEVKACFIHLANFVTKDKTIFEAMFPYVSNETIKELLHRFLPENFERIIQTRLDSMAHEQSGHNLEKVSLT